MDTIQLAGSRASTTRLGFGCSSIMGNLNRRESMALLEHAYDAGIRHFDTAPMYGYGEAESCLGDLVRAHPGSITVTTKFGVPSQPRNTLRDAVGRVARPVLQAFPGLKKRLQRPSQPSVSPPEAPPPARTANPIFTAEQARQSLENSLRQLQTDHIHLWLLHDVNSVDLPDSAAGDALLRFLESTVQDGKVGAFGVGSDRNEIPRLLAQHSAYCRVTQYEWSVLNPLPPAGGSFRIHHRALSQNFPALGDLLKRDRERSQRWSQEAGADLADTHLLANLMLKAAYLLNPAGIVLFSSKRPKHIQENVAVVGDASLDAAARKLYEVFQRERPL